MTGTDTVVRARIDSDTKARATGSASSHGLVVVRRNSHDVAARGRMNNGCHSLFRGPECRDGRGHEGIGRG